MPTQIVATKLYIPPPRPNSVQRPRLIAQLNTGLHRKLTLISAPAGFGKTTLISSWLATLRSSDREDGSRFSILNSQFPIAWLSLSAEESDPARFLAYLVAALQTIAPNIGAGVLRALQYPQLPPIETLLTALLNDLASIPDEFVLVLDDYHVVDATPVDQALAFLLEHLPPQMHLVITTREDPPLPLARYRARGHLTELRAADLRFTPTEAAAFLNDVMRLDLSAAQIAALESRTEGWIAGLQLAALSLHGQHDVDSFIRSFTGSHRFVLDYLLEEVLHQQPAHIQAFLLRTAILGRLCGPLCDAVLGDRAAAGHITLEQLDRANLFIVPLDDERRWYRYHHLFAELLRQRLHQSSASTEDAGAGIAALHQRASQWYEDNGLDLEAFQHAVAADDITRAERLIEGNGMPLQFRGAARPVLGWLATLPTAVLDASPGLWIAYASALLMIGQVVGVAAKADAAEAALQHSPLDDRTRDLIGRIASIRATVAVTQHQIETIIAQSRRALDYLRPDNLPVRASIMWSLGYAHRLQGDRAAARQAYIEAIAGCEATGHTLIGMMATMGLGSIQEGDNQLDLAAETYRRALHLIGEPPPPTACDTHLGMARICYQWNDLDAAAQHAHQGIHLARQIEKTDRAVACEVFLARLKLAQSDLAGAAATVAQADQSVRQNQFVLQLPDVVAVQVQLALREGDLAAAARLAQAHDLPASQARVCLAQGDLVAALALLEPARQQAEARGWHDERLRLLVLEALAQHAHGDEDAALHRLRDALALAEPGGFIRLFVDEGLPMAELLSAAAAHGMLPAYTARLLAAFDDVTPKNERRTTKDESGAGVHPSSLIEPLSQREKAILRLIASGQKNQQIADELMISLNTVRYHTKNLFGKLGVNTRTQAVSRAQALGML